MRQEGGLGRADMRFAACPYRLRSTGSGRVPASGCVWRCAQSYNQRDVITYTNERPHVWLNMNAFAQHTMTQLWPGGIRNLDLWHANIQNDS
jgi:hypothetical protein